MVTYSKATHTCFSLKTYLRNIQIKVSGHITRVFKTWFLSICTSLLKCLSLIYLLILLILNKFYSYKNHQKNHKHETENFSLLKGILIEFWGINIFPMTKETVACPKAIKSTWIHSLYESHQQETLLPLFWLGTQG